MKNPAIIAPSPRMLQVFAARALGAAPDAAQITPLTGDAGSRAYFRAVALSRSCIVAADACGEQAARFARLAPPFAAAGVAVPAILARQGNLLALEDFGDATYAARIAAAPGSAEELYGAALRALVAMQKNAALARALPACTSAMLHGEMALFEEWYCGRLLQKKLSCAAVAVLAQGKNFLAREMLAAPQAPMHRDYHSRNLMDIGERSPGVLDFQDAALSSPLYDVASLLRDAYVLWPVATQQRWLDEYCRLAQEAGVWRASADACERAYHIASAQRGLKVLGIFVRLARRDGKPRYLADLPVVRAHLLAACAAVSELAELGALLQDLPPPAAPLSQDG